MASHFDTCDVEGVENIPSKAVFTLCNKSLFPAFSCVVGVQICEFAKLSILCKCSCIPIE
jgi:hypothetical protein